MAVYLAPTFGAGYQAFGTDGLPLNGGFISTFAAGTANNLSTFTTSTGTVANANPIVLGTDGRPPQEIWLTGATTYLFSLVASSGVIIKTYDNLYGINDPAFAGGEPWVVAGGTGDAITATYAVPNTGLADGLFLSFRATAQNTSATPTFAPDGLLAHTITKFGGSAVQPGDIRGALVEEQVRYNLANTRWELMNPALNSVAFSTVPSASSINFDAIAPDYVAISGTSSISTLTLASGVYKQLAFTSTLILTSSASLILFATGDVSTRAGDVASFRGEGGGVTRCVQYFVVGRAPGNPLNVSTFSTVGSTTYTPAPGMKKIEVYACAGGAAGGGAASTGGGNVSIGGGGGAGGESWGLFFASTIGASVTVSTGASGVGVVAGTGTNGSTTTFGALITCSGGVGGLALATSAPPVVQAGSAGGVASGGYLNKIGASGSAGIGPAQGGDFGGYGGSAMFGTGGTGGIASVGGSNTGNAAIGFGAGGGGAATDQLLAGRAGGAGAPGLVIVKEFF